MKATQANAALQAAMESRRAEILEKDAERVWNAVVKRREADLRKKIDAMGLDANEAPGRVRKE